jgi:hypothetical protein
MEDCADGDEVQSRAPSKEVVRNQQALAELSQKVVQLTKVIVFLHTRSDDHDTRCAMLRSACEEEVRYVASAAAASVEKERKRVNSVSARRERRFAKLEQKHEEHEEAAANGLAALRRASSSREAACRRRLGADDEARWKTVAAVRSQVEQLRSELDTSVHRAHSDKHWLERQLAAEAAQERLRMDKAFEAETAELKKRHSAETEELKAARASATEALRLENSEARDSMLTEAQEETIAAAGRQGESFEAERQHLEEQVVGARAELAEARDAAVGLKDECAAQQRELDNMSRELQEKKRRAHFLSSEADHGHDRRLQAEVEARDLRRQKASIERLLGGASAAPQTERALAGLSQDLRSAQTRLQTLRGELARTQRLAEERRAAMQERGQRATRLGQELLEERRRADELQRVLLRLEQST